MSAAFDIGLVISESRFYQQQLGLDQQSLTTMAQTHGVDLAILEKAVALCIPGVITKDFVVFLGKELSTEAAGQAVEELLKFIPFVGSLLGAPISFVLTQRTMLSILGRMEAAANQVIDICVKKAYQQALQETGQDCQDLRNKKPTL
ncbi:uncharacterized protein LOC129581996 [Paramacrobiotus metropolitanus]|uniref:uncharacterized protein LOC129581996 n=1 Tax=Paramacrobiotus metropolitanus TaxID=2943436 RepID=UPI00244641E0|nr:uncharacterized protein LOC129581996 [Paramacrobiotus metropolitanus]